MSKRSNPFWGSMYVDAPATREALPSEPNAQNESSSQSDESRTEPLRLVLPTRYTKFEPSKALSAFNDDPIFNAKAAGRILAVSVECLKKWRQRKRGPSYIQYGDDGPVRYAWSALKQFRAQHTIHPGKGKEMRRGTLTVLTSPRSRCQLLWKTRRPRLRHGSQMRGANSTRSFSLATHRRCDTQNRITPRTKNL